MLVLKDGSVAKVLKSQAVPTWQDAAPYGGNCVPWLYLSKGTPGKAAAKEGWEAS